MAFESPHEIRAPRSGGSMRGELGEDKERDYPCWDGEEEVLADNEGSEEDRRFDSIVGALEEAVLDPTFASVQQKFVDEWCGEFVDPEENLLIYTDLFQQYTQLVERHIEDWLRERIPAFSMEAFIKMASEREDEIIGDVFDMLVAMGDFSEFKEMMLAHREGRRCGIAEATARLREHQGLDLGSVHGHRDSAALPVASKRGIYSGERKC